jgi:WD40 repeat protein
VAFSPDERLLAVSTGSAAEFYTVRPWQPHARIELPADAADRIQLAFSADGKLVACQIHDHVVQVLDTARMEELLRVQIDRGDSVVSLAYSDDDSRLVAGTRDGKLHVWNLDLIRRALAPLGLDWSRQPLPPPLPEAKPLTVRYFVPPRAASAP